MYKIYLISAETDGTLQWKIGITKNTDKRLQTLKVGNPNILGIQAVYEIDDRIIAYRTETLIKKRLSTFKVAGEWFSASSLNVQTFMLMCEKCEQAAMIWKNINMTLYNDKNKIYR